MSSNRKILANRQNAQRSTGPRTAAGKQRSSLNAIRHGLTGQVVLLPKEDLDLYQSFCQAYLDEWKPQGPTEKNLVQTLAEQQWRLHRAHARERAVYALGFDEFGDTIGTENPQVHSLLIAAQTDLEQSVELDRLSRYASRIQRDFHNTLKELKTLQTERKAREQSEQYEANNIFKLMQMQEIPWNPAEDGFTLSLPQITQYSRRQYHGHEAQRASDVDFNKKKYQAAGGHLQTAS